MLAFFTKCSTAGSLYNHCTRCDEFIIQLSLLIHWYISGMLLNLLSGHASYKHRISLTGLSTCLSMWTGIQWGAQHSAWVMWGLPVPVRTSRVGSKAWSQTEPRSILSAVQKQFCGHTGLLVMMHKWLYFYVRRLSPPLFSLWLQSRREMQWLYVT